MARSEKSGGGGGGRTWKDTTTEWDKLPLVPVTVPLNVIVGVLRSVEKVRVALAVPPETRVTLTGLMLHCGQPIARQENGMVKLTMPANPLRLATRMVEVAEDPCWTVWKEGLAEIVKSGVIGPPAKVAV